MVEEINFHSKGYTRRIWHSFSKPIEEEPIEEKPKVNSAISECKPLLEKEMCSMNLSENERKLILGSEDELDLTIALIIVHCPNLKTLYLGLDFLHRNTLLPKVLYHFLALKIGSSTSALTKLERVHLAQDIPYLGCAQLIITFEPFTLEALDHDEVVPYTTANQGLGSLVSLSHLTKLEVALPILLGWRGDAGLGLEDVLPSSLEELCLRDDSIYFEEMIWDGETTIKAVRRWLENEVWKKCTPNLKRIVLKLVRSMEKEWVGESRNALMDICVREGLKFWSEKEDEDFRWKKSKDEKF
ncbi:hypothetical protein N0V90_004939 [Kalmusia sp. IMI 367209]|nr:hypothetical protein N0V90_004939 [Kalmusia sp. IMI 367209]